VLSEFRKPLVLFLSGFILVAIAALLKILHTSNADVLMIAGLVTQFASIIYAGIILLKQKK
jgi:hypothetical protein